MLSRGLRSGVRTIRFEWRAFCEERSFVFRQAAHDFVSRDLDKAFDAPFACSVEQDLRAVDVGPQKLCGIRDAAVHVRLRSKVDNSVSTFSERTHYRLSSANVTMHKMMASSIEPFKVVEVASVCECVEVDSRAVWDFEHKSNKGRTYEAGASGHKKFHISYQPKTDTEPAANLA